MKTLLALLAVVVGASAGFAQDDLVARRDEKLKAAFLKKADWITDYDKARETAKSTGKLMFTLFSRSYAPCPACHQLENGPLLADDFAKFAKDYVLYLHITTMIPGEKYGDLLEQKGGNAFPWLVFMDATGEIILEHQGERSAAGFAKSGEQAKAWLTLKEKADKGDAVAKVDFAILQLGMGKLSADEARKAIADAGPVTKEQQAKLDEELVNAEIRDEVHKLRSDEEAAALGKKFYARHKEGKAAPTADNALQSYYILILDAAEGAKDLDVFGGALKILKDKYGKLPQAAAFFEAKEKTLQQLQSPKK